MNSSGNTVTSDYHSVSEFPRATSSLEAVKDNGYRNCSMPRQAYNRLILVEPQRAVGELFTAQLSSQLPDIGISLAHTLQEAVRLLTESPRSVVLAEVRFSEGGVTRLAEVIRRVYPQSRLAVWTQQSSEYLEAQSHELQLAGILSKSQPVRELVAALRKLLDGETLAVTPEGQPRSGVPEVDQEAIRQLTGRQIEIMLLLSEGYSVKQVAQKLGLSVKAVDSLKYRLMKSLGFNDRVQLTRFAIRAGLIDP